MDQLNNSKGGALFSTNGYPTSEATFESLVKNLVAAGILYRLNAPSWNGGYYLIPTDNPSLK